ncbi:hypothetical protein BJV82DRAFT_696402 [Fennellomyces sp. T-0311]|nr:hypothetical protein BJV82DRAFT_696402 [Fennellomyces sp. T-0311]
MDNSKLCDAHCHPHDDVKHLDMIPKLKTGHITIMGVRQDDWDCVAKVTASCEKGRCIPAFEAPFALREWLTNLKQRLTDHPEALVGEVGLDRAARLLPGGAIEWHGVKPTTVQTSIEHQMDVLRVQLQVARELKRAVSVHCVQATGHLLQLLQATAKGDPVRLCLHSFVGSAGSMPQFLKVKGYVIYVSFSVAICGRLDKKKLQDLICAIPEDRLLLESDLNTPQGLDDGMEEIAKLVAEARKWTIEQTIEQTYNNWCTFVGYNKKIA